MTLLSNENNFALATFFVGEQTLWSQAETMTELTNITFDLFQHQPNVTAYIYWYRI
jgi:hypothetical protein